MLVVSNKRNQMLLAEHIAFYQTTQTMNSFRWPQASPLAARRVHAVPQTTLFAMLAVTFKQMACKSNTMFNTAAPSELQSALWYIIVATPTFNHDGGRSGAKGWQV